ncbi:MAG: UDP-3-O-(3-hydroxymyristoyl)glucosamine N-acyltransferase [Phycisphaerales bacterium]|nr:UDP-3-O-(3-hydroxymyristoyl)glucosamine N-acyltransferase [Phycisphaerales bacterium]
MITTSEIAALLEGELVGPGDLEIRALNTLDRAEAGTLSFIGSDRYAKHWPASSASAAIVSRGIEVDPVEGRALIVVENAELAMIKALHAISPNGSTPSGEVHERAFVDPEATIGAQVTIGPCATVGARSTVGDGSNIGANVSIGRDVTIGRQVTLHPGVVIQDRCSVGDGSILHPNVTIGGDGFGFRPAPDGRGLVKIPHIGTVEIGAGVEIGSGACIDRATFGTTRIGDGSKIDNLVQIAHNCDIGRCVVICGGTLLAGSVTIGDGTVVGGNCSIPDHVTVGRGCTLAAGTSPTKTVPDGETWVGCPGAPVPEGARNLAILRSISTEIQNLRRAQRALERSLASS